MKPAASRLRAFRILGCLLLAAPACAHAEPSPNTRMFVEVGTTWSPLDDQFGFTTGGLRICSVAPLRPSLDWSMAMAIVPGLLGTMDLDVAVPIPIGAYLQLVPRAGVSGLAAISVDVAGGAVGWNAGAGLVLAPEAPLSLRADYVARGFGFAEGASNSNLHSLSVGLGWRF